LLSLQATMAVKQTANNHTRLLNIGILTFQVTGFLVKQPAGAGTTWGPSP